MQVSYSYLAGIIISLVLGIMLGLSNLLEPSDYMIRILLYILVLSAGLSIGGIWGSSGFPSGRRALSGIVLGITIMGAGGLASYSLSLLYGSDPRLAVIIGFASGWYSLAGPLIALYDPFLGLVAFLANLFREILHIVLYPILAEYGWPCRGVSVGGATTMDTGLPVVVKFGGSEATLVALGQGIAITALAPITVSILLNS